MENTKLMELVVKQQKVIYDLCVKLYGTNADETQIASDNVTLGNTLLQRLKKEEKGKCLIYYS